jgi:E3 ubiquitin-protein ligase DMA1/2
MDASACVICLDNIRAGQPVFVASCGHGWHYRCIRPLLVKTYPQFLCPCCKSVCDLENSDGGSSSESETEN